MALATKLKKPAHHKKIQAHHHKKSKRYVAPYWPYLPMLLIVGVGLFINSVLTRPAVLGANSSFSSFTMLEETNKNRATLSEQPLALDQQLSAAAQAKAEDMAAHNYWSHVSPDGKSPWTYLAGAGYDYSYAGENLAYGFVNGSAVIKGWMNSQEHRDNILNANYTAVGFGVASARNYLGKGPEIIVVAEYARPADAVANISFRVDPSAQSSSIPSVKGTATEVNSKPVSRIQVWTGGNASWTMLAASALFGLMLGVLLVRHSLQLHRMLSRGEAFMVHHPWFDVAMVMFAMTAFILTRTSGLIR